MTDSQPSDEIEIVFTGKRKREITISDSESDAGMIYLILTVDKNDQIDESSDEEDLDESAGEYDDEDDDEGITPFAALTVLPVTLAGR